MQPAAAQHPPAATKRLPELNATVADTAEQFGILYEFGDATTMSIKEAEALPRGPGHWRGANRRPTGTSESTWRGLWGEAHAFYKEWDDPAKREAAVAELDGYLASKGQPGRCPLAHMASISRDPSCAIPLTPPPHPTPMGPCRAKMRACLAIFRKERSSGAGRGKKRAEPGADAIPAATEAREEVPPAAAAEAADGPQ